MGAHARGRRWEAFARSAVAYYGGRCHICGCGGAKQPDHLVPVTEHPELEWELANIRPAHGAPGNACPSCSAKAGRPVYCNQIRSGLSAERARRIIAERIAENGNAPPPGRPQPDPGAGRPW